MRRGPLFLASIGLALNLVLWGVPGVVAASAAAHLALPNNTPSLSEALAHMEPNQATPSERKSLLDGLVQLIGAESEAFQVAGIALQQQPPPADLGARANAAGQRVLEAVTAYIRAAQAITNRY